MQRGKRFCLGGALFGWPADDCAEPEDTVPEAWRLLFLSRHASADVWRGIGTCCRAGRDWMKESTQDVDVTVKLINPHEPQPTEPPAVQPDDPDSSESDTSDSDDASDAAPSTAGLCRQSQADIARRVKAARDKLQDALPGIRHVTLAAVRTQAPPLRQLTTLLHSPALANIILLALHHINITLPPPCLLPHLRRISLGLDVGGTPPAPIPQPAAPKPGPLHPTSQHTHNQGLHDERESLGNPVL